MTDATVKYGIIPKEDWYQPDWIDEEKAKAARQDMVKNNVIYGGAFVTADSRSNKSMLMIFVQEVYRTFGWSGFLCCCLISAPSRYRNMCRFNSGVSQRPSLKVNHCAEKRIYSSSTDKKF